MRLGRMRREETGEEENDETRQGKRRRGRQDRRGGGGGEKYRVSAVTYQYPEGLRANPFAPFTINPRAHDAFTSSHSQ